MVETYAYFTNIRSHIRDEIEAASAEIYVAVAWFTDQRLFQALCAKAKDGLDVRLMINDDAINQGSQLDYSVLEANGGKVFLINTSATDSLMHNKFCVIDGKVVITGSYNWSNRAGGNHENITITKNDEQLCGLFVDEFTRIKELYYGKGALKPFDANVVYKRLQIVLTLIALNEPEEIGVHYKKLCEYTLVDALNPVMALLERGDYATAEVEITVFLSKVKALTIDDEVGLLQLKWQIRYLEIEIVSLENERSGIEKAIGDFVNRYTVSFGELLLKILQRKKEILREQGNSKRSAVYEQAEAEYKQFEEEFKTASAAPIPQLGAEDRDELRRLYRKAVVLCHPDKFTEEDAKAKAHKIFTALQEAYQSNDLATVREIFEKLQMGLYEISEKSKLSRREELLMRLSELRGKHEVLMGAVTELRRNDTYKRVSSIKDMDRFWVEERERLERELESLNI